jgi:hypothetical protein
MTSLTQEEKLCRARVIDMRLNGKLLFPENSFPKEFIQPVVAYFSTMTDAPSSFLHCSALMMVSAVIGNRVFVQVGSQKLKVNLYLLMLAGSTVGRKSTGIQLARKYLRLLEDQLKATGAAQNTDVYEPTLNSDAERVRFLMADSGSLEGVFETMREPEIITVTQRDGKDKIQHQELEQKTVMNSGLAVYSEFAALLDMVDKEYNKGYKTALIDFYDGNDYERQLKKEQSRIKNPCLSMFGASTMTQFKQRIQEDDKHSGFLQRFLFSHETEQQRELQSLIQIRIPDDDTEKWILTALESIYQMSRVIQTKERPFSISSESGTIYQAEFDFDQAIIAHVSTTDKEFAGVLQGYFGRLDAMRFKVALIFQVVKDAHTGTNDLVISKESMVQACSVIAYFQGSIVRLLRDEFRFTPFEQKTKRVMDFLLKNSNQSTKRDLSRATKWPVVELDAVLNSGVLSGLWTVEDQTTPAGKKTVKVELCKTVGDT